MDYTLHSMREEKKMSEQMTYTELDEIEIEYRLILGDIKPEDHKRLSALREKYRANIERLSCLDQAYYFFGNQIHNIEAHPGSLVGFIVVRDEANLSFLIAKMKAYGFERIVVIDDHSSQEHLRKQEIASPAVRISVKNGMFGLSKVLWIESICNLLFDGSWIGTFDADEFIEIDSIYRGAGTFNTIAQSNRDLKRFLAQQKYPAIPFCLLDVLPDRSSESVASLRETRLLYYCGAGFRRVQDYAQMTPVRWSLGQKATAQYATDLRYHLYGISESRSKVSLLRWEASKRIMLHQGFHSMTHRSSAMTYDTKWAMASGAPCKTLIHQKILFALLNPPSEEKLKGYFPRTASNASKLKATLYEKESHLFSSLHPLHQFYGTIYMPSWTHNGKVIYTEESLLDDAINSLRTDYEFLCVSFNVFKQLVDSLRRFVGMRVIQLNRAGMYLQLRNAKPF